MYAVVRNKMDDSMKIDQVIEELRSVRKEHGNIEVTCTGSTLPDQDPNMTCGVPNVFETTVETVRVNEQHSRHGKAVRLWL
jgi:hypothetical protein